MASGFPGPEPSRAEGASVGPKDWLEGPDSFAKVFESKLSIETPDASLRGPPRLPMFSRPPPPPIPMPTTLPALAISQTISADHFIDLYAKALGDFASSSRSPGISDGSWSFATSGSPTLYSDPFVRGEPPLEAGDPRMFDPARFFSPPTPAFESKPMPYLPRAIRQRTRFDYCVFCKNNCEEEKFYLSHTLKDDYGCITCPILFSYTCPTCGATGRVAHTLRYCPKTKEGSKGDHAPANARKSARTSIGSLRGARRESSSGRSQARMSTSQPEVAADRACAMRNRPGPNSAWTGIRVPPPIKPMSGDLINREMREANASGMTQT